MQLELSPQSVLGIPEHVLLCRHREAMGGLWDGATGSGVTSRETAIVPPPLSQLNLRVGTKGFGATW